MPGQFFSSRTPSGRVIQDLDGNELFFWDWPERQTA
jgi:hypothetical protein